MALEPQTARMFINITDHNEIAVVDRSKLSVIGHWSLENAGENSPMVLDAANHRLFVVCRKPARLVVFDTLTGKQLESMDTAGRSDGMAFDSVTKRIYVPGGEGYVAVYEQKDGDHYQLVAKVPSAVGAKTCLFVPELNRLYVAVSPGEGKFGARLLTFETLP
jgi:DNA-binding beta-propeller fold protein YncE